MADRLPTIWKIDPHTQAKHIILKEYLDAWLPIMTSWNGRVLYIDGFAGPGKYERNEDGSPIIALKSAVHHRAQLKAEVVFCFVEAEKERYQHLDSIVKEMTLPQNFKTQTIHGKFDDTVTGLLDSLNEQKTRIAPAFVFVDPFGFSHTPFRLIKESCRNHDVRSLLRLCTRRLTDFLIIPTSPKDTTSFLGPINGVQLFPRRILKYDDSGFMTSIKISWKARHRSSMCDHFR